MAKMKILIVEDNIIEATKLEMELTNLNYEVPKIVDSKAETIACFYTVEPDLLILDINLNNGETGIDIAKELKKRHEPKPIIYLTSSEDKKTFEEAKKTGPCAFLLKPFDIKNLTFAIELALEDYASSMAKKSEEYENSLLHNGHLFVKKNKKIVKLNVADIEYVDVDGKYSMIHTNSDKYLVRVSLKDLYEKLKKQNFVRIHRNYLINIEKMKVLDLEDETMSIADVTLPIGKSYKKLFADALPFLK